jgi:hypothetical protein
MYLLYMSYINNTFHVNFEQREKAAQMFYKVIIASEVPSRMKGRSLVEATIAHILNWCLRSNELASSPHKFGLLIFRVYDFLMFLDMGTIAEFEAWIEAIYSHPSLLQ